MEAAWKWKGRGASSEVDNSRCQTKSLAPERGWGVREFDDIPHRSDTVLDLLLINNQRRRQLKHAEIVSADLRENSVIAEQAHNQYLPEHRGVNLIEGFIGQPQIQFPGRAKFHAEKQAFAPNFPNHFERAEHFTQPGAEMPPSSALRAARRSLSSVSRTASPTRIASPFSEKVEVWTSERFSEP